MPFRSARTIIRNTTGNCRLTRTFSHLCAGGWTPGGWEPPAVIECGQSGGMQSQSNGIVTGAEGYAKYDITSADRRLGMIHVYWNNPILGVTCNRFFVHRSAVLRHCDYGNPDETGTFYEMDATVDVHLAPVRFFHTDTGSDIIAPGDLASAFAAGPVGRVGWLAGLQRVYPDAGWEYELREGAYRTTSSSSTDAGHAPASPPLPERAVAFVPDLAGLTAQEVVDRLATAGLRPLWFHDYSFTEPEGIVVQQHGAAGAAWGPGSQVRVTMSLGRHPYLLPGPTKPPWTVP